MTVTSYCFVQSREELEDIRWPEKPFAVFLICAESEAPNFIEELCQELVTRPAFYVCCAGPTANLLEDIVDEVFVMAELEGKAWFKSGRDCAGFTTLMTVSDTKIEEGLDFFYTCVKTFDGSSNYERMIIRIGQYEMGLSDLGSYDVVAYED